MEKIVLASGSPRRREILSKLGFDFQVKPSDIDEKVLEEEEPGSYVLRMAVQKALAAAEEEAAGLFIGADTVVVVDGKIIGKPRNAEEAKEQLRLLSAREHIVITGIGIVDKYHNRTVSSMEQTIVYFNPLSEGEIDAYVASGEPLDKAGSYGIQGLGAVFVRRIEGDYFNVVGLPVSRLYGLLSELGYNFWQKN